MLPRYVRISEIVDENAYTKTLVLDDVAANAAPGQFVMLWIPGMDEKPFALVERDPLTLTVAAVGPFSRAVHVLRVGDSIGWRGPYGRGFDLNGERESLLIGGGYGTAALYFAATELAKRSVPMTVAIGGRSKHDILFENKLCALGARVIVATEDGSRGFRGLVTEAVHEVIDRRPRVLACGPEGMLVAVVRLAMAKQIPAQLSTERYMKCGFGVCGQCSISGQLVCQDGPVFSAEELERLPEFGRSYRDASGAVHSFPTSADRRK